MLGLVNYEDSDDDAPEAPAPTNGHEKAAPVAPSQAQASPPSASPPSGPSGSPPQEEDRWEDERKGAIKRVSHAPSDLVRRPTIGPPPASRDWSNPYVLERLVQAWKAGGRVGRCSLGGRPPPGTVMYTFWSELDTKNCPGPRAAHSCDIIDGRLYLFGGWNGKRALNDLHVLDVASGTWSEVLPSGSAPSARNNHTTAVVDSRLVVHGGHDGNKWVADMHILETSPPAPTAPHEGLVWHKAPTSGTPPSARACHTLTRLAHKLYMFGGYDGAKCFNETWTHRGCDALLKLMGSKDMDIIDLETMTWMQPNLSGTLPQARNAHTMTVISTKLYLFGLRGHTANLIGHKIFLFGGYDGKGRTNELYILDTAEAKWVRPTWPTESPHTPPGRQRHSASLIGSKRIYIFGGFDGNKWLNDLHVLDESALNDVAVHTLIENMGKLLRSGEFSDIIFVVEGKRIYAHKAILIAQCEHFRAMFAGGRFAESREAEIEIPQWSHVAFSAMLEWLYTGHAPRELSAEHLTEVGNWAPTGKALAVFGCSP
eukprot:g31632.t1